MIKFLSSALASVILLSCHAFAANPIITQNDTSRIYCGDPAVLVDGDTVYLYAGRDEGDGVYYNMPDYLCYSSKDMTHWTYEGIPLSAADFPWGKKNDSWAGHVVKYNEKYYFFNCKNGSGISVAVSDSPTGPFKNLIPDGQLIYPSWTKGLVGWDDIDPAVWIEDDASGVTHRYICWGNSNFYMAELTEDMTSLTDLNGDGTVDGGDIRQPAIELIPQGHSYTEAPWIYKRNGIYYLFFATNFHEELSYATADNIWGPYTYGGILMETGASSNTNHPAVVDFKGETYLFYHTGAQPNGGGYLRNVCISRLVFSSDGHIAQLEEYSPGIDSASVRITLNGKSLYHSHFNNPYDASLYPLSAALYMGGESVFETDSLWQIENLTKDTVCIESVNKMGYYITNYGGFPRLLHDKDDTPQSLLARTFIVKTENGASAFESASNRGTFLSINEFGALVLTASPTYFTILPGRAESQVSITNNNDSITVTGAATADSDTVITIKSSYETKIIPVRTDSNGNLSYSFQTDGSDEYEIYCLGRMFKFHVGGESK